MLRERLSEDLKTAMRAKDQRALSTIRMVLAELKLRDINAREKGNTTGVGEPEIVDMMQKLVRQRRDSIEAYEKGGRPELAAQEGDRRHRRHDGEGHGAHHGAAEREVCRPDGLRQGRPAGEAEAGVSRPPPAIPLPLGGIHRVG
jgi:hypothetical protein